MTLDEKLEQIEDTVYGANWRNLIAALKLCRKQRNDWMGDHEDKAQYFWVTQDDSDLLKILNGEE